MTHSIVGVDIGSESIRAVEIESPGTPRAVIRRYGEYPLPDGAVESGKVVELNTVATILKQLWVSSGFRSKKIILGVGNARTLVRDLTVPRAGARQIRLALPFHVQELLTVPVADAILDFYPVSEGTDATGPVLHGLLVAAVKETVTANVAAAQLAGLTPVDVDLIPFALVRVQARAVRHENVAFVDIGARTTTIVVAVRGVPHFVRIIPTGGQDLTRALAEQLEILPEQAETLKRTIGLQLPDDAGGHNVAAVAAIHDYSSDLLDGIRNTLNYFSNAHPETPMDRILVSGGGGHLSGFLEVLREATMLPTSVPDPLSEISFAPRFQHSPGDRPEVMAVALGLALGRVA